MSDKPKDSETERSSRQGNVVSLNRPKTSPKMSYSNLFQDLELGRQLTKRLSMLSEDLWETHALIALSLGEISISTQSEWTTWRLQKSLEDIHRIALDLNQLSKDLTPPTAPSCA